MPALYSAGQWQGELPLRKPDGQSYMAEMICALVKDDRGRPIYLLANFYNITDRKRAEEALLLDDSRLEALQKLNQMDEASIKEIADFALEAGVKLTGSHLGYLAFVDEEEKTLTMHSWSRKAMQECNIEHKRIVYHVQDTGLWGEAIRQRKAVITNDYASCPQKRGTPAGHVEIIRHMNVPILDKGRIVIVAGLGNKEEEYHDSDVRQLTLLMSGMWKIILRRRTEEDLKKSQEELEKRVADRTAWLLRANVALHEEMVKHKNTEIELRSAQQAADGALRAKSEFLANMSHEIRTPMNAVIGLAGLLLETDLTAEQRDFVETIHSSGDALLAIINDILDFSKIDEGKMKLERLPFNLRECIEESLDMVAAKALEKNLTRSYAIDKAVAPTVLGDFGRLRQVLANLLSNAVKFTDNGSISIRVLPGENPEDIHISVSDTGIGIRTVDMKKLFRMCLGALE
jgi:signal transduction histidine kinase